MKNLFEQQHANEFIERINKLTPASQALWGKMNVAQMLTHCQKPFEIASGDLKPKPNAIIKFLFGKRAKQQLLTAPEFKRNLPTFKEAIIVDDRVFEAEKNKLVKKIETFQQKAESGITKDAHPFFGDLSVQEWNILQTKHLDHHLKQFGV